MICLDTVVAPAHLEINYETNGVFMYHPQMPSSSWLQELQFLYVLHCAEKLGILDFLGKGTVTGSIVPYRTVGATRSCIGGIGGFETFFGICAISTIVL